MGRTSSLSSLHNSKCFPSETERKYFSPKNNLLNNNKILVEIKKLREGNITKQITYSNILSNETSKTLQTIKSTINTLCSPRSYSSTNLIRPGFIKNDLIIHKNKAIINRINTEVNPVSKTLGSNLFLK
jgi:hypothetical protein